MKYCSIWRWFFGIFCAGVAMFVCVAAVAQGVRSFGVPEGRFPLRGFGNPSGEEALMRQFPELSAVVTANDRQQARWEMAKTDGNLDGLVTEVEWAASGYQPLERFKSNDLNGDGKLTLFEHSLRWAQHRIGRARQQHAVSRTEQRQTRETRQPAELSNVQEGRQEAMRRQQMDELARYTLSLYDRDQSGVIDRLEFRSTDSPFGNVAPAETGHNGTVDQQELAAWLLRRFRSQLDADLPAETPGWFLTSDLDNDGQVQMSEFLASQSQRRLADFGRIDSNNDGFVTLAELTLLRGARTQRYSSSRGHVIGAEGQTCAQLLITDPLIIGDIDVQISVMKNGDDDIELELISPNGARASLYFDNRSKPWGGGRLLNNTVIDDEAPDYPQRLPHPPLIQTFRPQSMNVKGLNSLKVFYGTPARGAWRMIIRNKSRVAGLLEGWALLITPQETP
jgi:Ca2+-binding EF-hand superfamily protein